MSSTQTSTENLEWSSTEVQAGFQSYWDHNCSYLKAKSAAFDKKVPWMPATSKTLPIFQTLGFLEVQVGNTEEFVRSGPIHPILQRSNWILDPQLPHREEVLQIMSPAFRVVSEFLYSEAFHHWWLQVRFGRRSSTSPVHLESDFSKTPADVAPLLVQRALLELADHVKFTWLAEDPMGEADGSTAGSIGLLLQYLRARTSSKEKTNITPRRPTIALSMRYYNLLLGSKNMTPSENMRLQFTVAKLILHELGHAFFVYWKGFGPECRVYESDIMAEVGFSLEVALFGGIIQCEGLDADAGMTAIGPMMAFRIEDLFPIQRPMVSFVPMEWVQQWFNIATWDRAAALKSKEGLHVVTTNYFPKLMQIVRWTSGRLAISLEHSLTSREANMIALAMNCPINRQSKATREADKHGSVASWYEIIWPKDAVKALKAGNLKGYFFKPNEEYAALFPAYTEPTWTTLKNAGLFKDFVHASRETLSKIISKL